MRIASLSLLALCLTLAALPAVAQCPGGDCYDNGPANGQVDAWTINFGFTVSDSFHLSGPTDIESISFYAWLIPGDTVSNVEVQLGNEAFGNEILDTVANMTQSNCFANNFGYNVCQESGSLPNTLLQGGNYWVTLGNATVPSGDPVYWDENSGVGCTSPGCPSSAQENTVGTIPSEAFTLDGQAATTSTSTSTSGTTPEPSSIMLFGSGILGLAGLLRRKLF